MGLPAKLMFGCRYVNQPLDYSGQYGMGYLKRMSRCPNCREDEASVLARVTKEQRLCSQGREYLCSAD